MSSIHYSSSKECASEAIMLKRAAIGLSYTVAYCATMQAPEPFAM